MVGLLFGRDRLAAVDLERDGTVVLEATEVDDPASVLRGLVEQPEGACSRSSMPGTNLSWQH